MKNIAVVAGGYSGEYSVSLKSQAAILSFLAPIKAYRLFAVVIERNRWEVHTSEGVFDVDKNDFSFTAPGEERIKFDYCYMTIHGTPGEDGLFLGYLETLGIPFSSCSALVSALTFNKSFCNRYLSSFGLPVSRGLTVKRGESKSPEEITRELGLPLFVKPNCGGSSIATHKVEKVEELDEALRSAFTAGDEVLVERMLVGTEVTCGCYEDGEGLHALPVTEVVPKGTFFDFDAKYNGASDEITPARIPEELSRKVQDRTKAVYDHLGAKGLIRVDYIIEGGEPVLLEVNTTPGMTTASFIPQQVRAAGLDITDVLHAIIEK